MGDDKVRCPWALQDPLYIQYHDQEWGTPERDELKVFQHLCLEVFQFGLSWLLILKRRPFLMRALLDFEPMRLAEMDEEGVMAALQMPMMIRSPAKVLGVVNNARALLRMWDRGLSLSDQVWSAVGGVPIVSRRSIREPLPPSTEESRALSRRLKSLGFVFTGPVVCYSLMQAVGAVDDHGVECFRHSFNRNGGVGHGA
ncbi:3-methyladenine DNA glycosylase [Thermanaerovibrio velox DSM 12556]|uniref:3-methyladenine DNA glycosylase n=1 Tax=Thermanaerovibrio velox DSM 12556 TaxID=926567 RepID=H0UQ62_9BACT|nr:DNA-3-methyladenine glycosylase I [Thermanaerovibrio velox]EHM10700.1 3-methyladenine DNA glycosylase [Thermanaerovibrio velox DSM 12556]